MTARRSHLLVLLLAVCFVAAGCGVSSDAAPHDIPANDVPFDLVAAASPTDTPTAGGDSGQVQSQVARIGSTSNGQKHV